MKRPLLVQAFLAMLVVALLTVVLSGLITRTLFSSAFQGYLDTLPRPAGQGMGMGRHMMLGGAEQAFLGSVDRGILVGALIAIGLAGVAAWVVAYYLTRPIERLTAATRMLAGGDLTHRVDVGGPGEVAALGEAFNDMADSLAESEELRRRLVADVAHELRNPIASLRAQAEGIAEGVLVADERRLGSLADDTRHLSRLVEDLQELSAAEAGQLRYEMQSTDLAALACGEVDRARVRARATVELRCEADSAIMVDGDEGRLGQVLRNLIDNALRHTETGSVTVSCAATDGHARVEVRDTGEGIPDADLPHIFERFYRADTARACDTGGSGVGLAVSRRIVEDHGGKVFASNASGGGAVVGFEVPLAC
ncbi:MAG: HAMP domain-containing sensor histidine kinase [Coriobacteriia bacterium]